MLTDRQSRCSPRRSRSATPRSGEGAVRRCGASAASLRCSFARGQQLDERRSRAPRVLTAESVVAVVVRFRKAVAKREPAAPAQGRYYVESVSTSAACIRRTRPPGWMAWLALMGDDLFGREVCVGVPFLRRRVPVAEEIDVQPAADRARTVASTQRSVAAPTTTTVVMPCSDKRSPNSVSKSLSVPLLRGCGLAREQDR